MQSTESQPWNLATLQNIAGLLQSLQAISDLLKQTAVCGAAVSAAIGQVPHDPQTFSALLRDWRLSTDKFVGASRELSAAIDRGLSVPDAPPLSSLN